MAENQRTLDTYEKIQPLIQKEINDAISKYAQQQKFTVAKVPYHIHNGIDSPPLINPSVSYIGFVPYMEDAGLQYILPGGWSIRYEALTGVYTIIHNLGIASDSNFYSCVVSATQSTNQTPVAVVSNFENEVTVNWFDIDGITRVTTSFNFILTTGNNKSAVPPRYVTRNVT